MRISPRIFADDTDLNEVRIRVIRGNPWRKF